MVSRHMTVLSDPLDPTDRISTENALTVHQLFYTTPLSGTDRLLRFLSSSLPMFARAVEVIKRSVAFTPHVSQTLTFPLRMRFVKCYSVLR